MASFTEILNKPASAVEKPKPYPVGVYLAVVDGPFKERTVNSNPVIDWILKPVQAVQVSDQEALAKMGGLGRTIRHTIFLTDQDGVVVDWPLKKFLCNDLGIEEGQKTMSEIAAEAPGKQVLITIKHAASKDGSEVFANVGSTAKV